MQTAINKRSRRVHRTPGTRATARMFGSMVLASVVLVTVGDGMAEGLQTKPVKTETVPVKPLTQQKVPATKTGQTGQATAQSGAICTGTVPPQQGTGTQPVRLTPFPKWPGQRAKTPNPCPNCADKSTSHKTGEENKGPEPIKESDREAVKETSREPNRETNREQPSPRTVRTPPAVLQKDRQGHATEVKTASGAVARVNPKTGKVTSLHKVDTDGSVTNIHTSPSGARNVETIRRDSYGLPIRTVSHGNSGYQERVLQRRPGYLQRTYYQNGRTYTRVYHAVRYGNLGFLPVYVPERHYHPAFYVYLDSPFPASVTYSWGTSPGYAAYGGYFTPASTYNTPAAFVADYTIGANLGSQQQGGIDGPAGTGAPGAVGGPTGSFLPASGGAQAGGVDLGGSAGDGSAQPDTTTGDPRPIPADVHDAYVQQVQGQIDQARVLAGGAQTQSTIPGALDPNFKIFQSYSDVEADLNGQQCALVGGDFVRREELTPDSNGTIAVTVVTVAKPTASHCPEQAKVRLPLTTLQDWYNSFQAAKEQGFAAMAAEQGKDGFPPAGDVATVVDPNGQGTPDDAHVLASAIQQQQTDGGQLQAEAQPGGSR